jgi:hypothetical protein
VERGTTATLSEGDVFVSKGQSRKGTVDALYLPFYAWLVPPAARVHAVHRVRVMSASASIGSILVEMRRVEAQKMHVF